MTARMLDLYAMHPESVPAELREAPMCDVYGQALEVGDFVRLEDMGVCRITGRNGAWIRLDQGGEPAVAFITELQEGIAVRPEM